MFECYKWINKINGKAYIGIVLSPNKNYLDRWKEHQRDKRKSVFHQAIKKYKPENFQGEILSSAATIEEVKEIEIQMIAEHKTHISEGGYNMTLGGDGTSGTEGYWKEKCLPENMVEKIRNSRIGQLHDQSTKDKISNSLRGMEKSKTHTKNISVSKRGDKNPMFGRTPWNKGKRKNG